MVIQGLVSIITPCYNSGAFIHRLLDSILMQDYPSIEMFAIDDGSTDNTKEVIGSYIPKFQKRGYKLTYLYQDNAGQAAALNRGLKLVTGDFLTWPDSDDFYTKTDSISTFVSTLRDMDETYGAVCFIGTFVNENTLANLGWELEFNKSENLFCSCLLGEAFLAIPINYMIRTSALDDVNPKRDIYTGRHPQNMQMFLPLFYSFKCRTIIEPQCNILVRSSSHSHTIKPYKQQLDDIEGYYEIKINTLDHMHKLTTEERRIWKKQSKIRALQSKQALAIRFKKYQEAKSYTKSLKELGVSTNIKTQIKILFLNFPLIHNFVSNV